MRDYKNVKVPRKYRASGARVSVKRVDVGHGSRRYGSRAAGLKSLIVNIAGFAVIAGSCWAGWQAYKFTTQSGMFQVSGVDVKGVHHLSKAALEAIAGPFTGQNIFRADIEAAARRARENPWIREVRIHRALPNRITMKIIERVPHIVLETDEGRYLADSEAVVIERIGSEGSSAGPLPTIQIKNRHASPGEPIGSDGAIEAMALLAEIEARGGWNTADVTLKAGSPEALSIVYAGCEFRIGSGRHAEKLRRLGEIMTDVKQRGLNIAYVDLRPENQAAVMVMENAGKSQTSNSRRQVKNRFH